MMTTKKPSKAFIAGVLTGAAAHAGAWLALATLDKLFYILGHVGVVLALHAVDRLAQR